MTPGELHTLSLPQTPPLSNMGPVLGWTQTIIITATVIIIVIL